MAVLLAVTGVVLLSVGLSAQTHPPSPPAALTTRPAPGTSGGAPAVAGPVLPRSVPTVLDVPRLGVHHALMQLGLNPDGTVQVPPLSDVQTPGWYRESPTPGQLGPAVILGHVDAAVSGKGVFFDLGTMRPGDVIAVTRADGTVAEFTVTGIGEYPKSSFPTRAVYGDLNYAGLRLITCGGAFDRRTRNYLDNIVVFARLQSSHPAS